MNKKEIIYITQPVLPSKKEVHALIDDLWKSKRLTNQGKFNARLCNKLQKYFNVNYASVFSNGTIALELAIQALQLKGEIITTPFTFPATIHSIFNNNVQPVFCDIKMEDYNIDEEKIEKLITKKTTGIMPVHVYGRPCNVKKIGSIAKKYNLKVIYDAAHAFGVKIGNKSIARFGNITMFSFHATKIFHTFEGGALTYSNKKYLDRLFHLRNFGIINEETVVSPGTNAKMNEFQCGIGLLLLDKMKKEIGKREIRANMYLKELHDMKHLKFLHYDDKNITYNYSYFPILIKPNKDNITRDIIHNILQKNNIVSRKYFYPLCSNYSFYRHLRGAKKRELPNANYVSNNILCLPLYGDLPLEQVKRICGLVKSTFSKKCDS